ncbi:MAG: S8 family serine peptidase [Bryobacteraceae bacterium]
MRKLASCFLLAVIACAAPVPKKKVSSDLKKAAQSGSVQVIVQWNTETGDATEQKISALGGTVISQFHAVDSGVYVIPSTAVGALETDKDVKFISVDRNVVKKAATISITPGTINAPAVWNSGYNGQGIGVAVLDSGINSDDDLGTYLHDPVYSQDFTVPTALVDGKPPKKPASYGLDWYGHGQHIAGIIASNGKSSNCGDCTQVLAGIAPGVNLINLKVLDASGQGSDSYVIAALDRAIALKNTYNIRVMNLSLGRPVYESYTEDPLCQAVEAAWKAGIVVVVSAGNDGRDNSFGNDGYSTVNAPGNDPYVITVGAMRSMGTATRADDLIASYSSKGPSAVDHIVKPDLVAPGNQIVSLLAEHETLALDEPQNLAPLNAYKSKSNTPGRPAIQPSYDPQSGKEPPTAKAASGYSNKYFVLSGTSMAAAVVSGAAADLLQAVPSLTPDQVKMLLMKTASKNFPTVSTVTDQITGQTFTSYYDVFTVGAGYLDVAAALASAQSVPAGITAISPTASYDAATGNVDLSFDPTSVFSDKAMWGANTTSANKALWGASATWSGSVLSGNKALWGASAVWGATSDTSANKALWGADAIWTNKALWGANTGSTSQSVMVNGEQ